MIWCARSEGGWWAPKGVLNFGTGLTRKTPRLSTRLWHWRNKRRSVHIGDDALRNGGTTRTTRVALDLAKHKFGIRRSAYKRVINRCCAQRAVGFRRMPRLNSVLGTQGCESTSTSTLRRCEIAPEQRSGAQNARIPVDVVILKMRCRSRIAFWAPTGANPR